MIIRPNTFTEEAVSLVEIGKEYDREELAMDVARSLSKKLYSELGGVRAMSLRDLDNISKAFYSIAMSLIDWTRCNRKVHPEEYADLRKDGAWPQPIMVGGEL